MQITNELEFDAIDRFGWATFLKSRAGLRLLPKCLESCPQLLGSGDTNSILIKTGELRGFQHAIQTLLSLAEPPPKEQPAPPSAYPPLESDEQWMDGQTLTQK